MTNFSTTLSPIFIPMWRYRCYKCRWISSPWKDNIFDFWIQVYNHPINSFTVKLLVLSSKRNQPIKWSQLERLNKGHHWKCTLQQTQIKENQFTTSQFNRKSPSLYHGVNISIYIVYGFVFPTPQWEGVPFPCRLLISMLKALYTYDTSSDTPVHHVEMPNLFWAFIQLF